MMTYTVSLRLKAETYQCFQTVHTQLNQGSTEPQAKRLGDNFAEIACEIIDQAFGQLVNQSSSAANDSNQALKQVKDALMKYMPWSVSFFGNDRLLPMVNHVHSLMYQAKGTAYISYQVDKVWVKELLGCAEKMRDGQSQYVVPGLKAFTKVVDQGVTSLIREPKKMLKFNLVVNKTLDGVIALTTQMGYKRFEKLSSLHDAKTITAYLDHFLVFLDNDAKHKVG